MATKLKKKKEEEPKQIGISPEHKAYLMEKPSTLSLQAQAQEATQEARTIQEQAQIERQIQTLPAQEELALKQKAEIEKVEELRVAQPQLSVAERNVLAGQAAMFGIAQTLGVSEEKITAAEARGVPTLGKIPLTIFGKVTTLGGRWGSLSNLFSKSNQGNLKNLESDAASMILEGTAITKAATSKGANVQDAITSLTQLEGGVRSRYADATMALRASPQDAAEGLELTDSLSFKLRKIIEQRQALERYQLTGDINQVLNLVGVDTGEMQ